MMWIEVIAEPSKDEKERKMEDKMVNVKDELVAVERLLEVLKPFELGARNRIIKYATSVSYEGIGSVSTSTGPFHQNQEEEG